MEFLEWVGRHPILTVVLVLVIGGSVEEIARAIRGR